MKYGCLFIIALFGCVDATRAYEFNPPADAGVIDVKRDHGAKGDGVTDDTEAIRAAIKEGIERGRYTKMGFVYFPRGTYLVSGPLESRISSHGWSGGWRCGMILIGQDRDQSIIKLKDNAPGYGDASKPKWLIATGSESDKRTKKQDKPLLGGGNRAFRHYILNLTVDVGQGNPGAIGIDFVVSNRGGVEDVTIKAPANSGHVGLNLQRWWPGPGLIKRVRIEGFDHAMKVGHWQYGMTFEHIELTSQRKAAIVNDKNVLAIRGLVSHNDGPVIVARDWGSTIALLDSKLTGSGKMAIHNKGQMLLRNVQTTGYDTALIEQPRRQKPKQVNGDAGMITEHATTLRQLGTKRDTSLNLPIKETPEYHSADLSQWISGAPAEGNDATESLQAAIDSGKPIVYLPNGSYNVTKTIIIRGGVKKIIGLHASLQPKKGTTVDPLIRFEGGSSKSVTLEYLRLHGKVVHDSAKALAIRHCDFRGYENTARGSGDMFFDDTIGKPIRILHPQNVWGRQVNCEFGDDPLIENHGGNLWILGYKTEGQMICIKGVGGNTEVFGALLYPLRKVKPHVPMFSFDGGSASLNYRLNGQDYPIHVQADEGKLKLMRKQVPGRGAGLTVIGNKTP